MTKPTNNAVHTDEVLTNISVAYFQNQSTFVADKVFPIVPVHKQSDLYRIFSRADFNRVEAKKRAPGTESAGGGFAIDTGNYFCDVFAFHKDLDRQTEVNADDVLRLRANCTEYVTRQLLLKREKDFMTAFVSPSVWTYDYDGVSSSPTAGQVLQWNDDNSTPIEDIRFAQTTIQKGTGFRPNKLLLGQEVFDALIDHPDIVDRIKYGQTSGGPAVANEEALAKIFGVDRVMISGAIENTAKEGQSESNSFMAGKRALLVHAPAGAGLETPTAGYTFTWAGYTGLNTLGINVSSIPMDHLKATRIEAEAAYDQKVISPELGFFWDAVVA